MRSNAWLATLAFLVFFQACAKPDPHDSGVKQLVENDFVCPGEPGRIAFIEQNYGRFLQGGSEGHRQDVVEALSLLPNEYLHWVFDHNRVAIALRQTGGSTRGATTSVGRGGDWRPESIWVGQMTGNFNPMNHEFGHATQHYLAATFPEFKRDLQALFRETSQTGEARLMRGYARSNETEFFAELFDSYYCGEESRDYVAEHMPLTFAFMENYLIDPTKLAEGTSGNATLAGLEGEVDEDQDKVSNHYDQCAGTESGATVSFQGSTYGCAADQLTTEE